MHLIFLQTYSPRFCPPPESGQGFSIRPFPFALKAIEFEKKYLNLLKKIEMNFWISIVCRAKGKAEWKNLDDFQGGGRT